MLSGGTLCGVRDDVTIRFRGDAHMQAWIGVLNANVHNITLDSSCLMDTHEQTHMVRITIGGLAINDVRMWHPKRSTTAGDNINLVGLVASPFAFPVIDHIDFAACARFGVQVTRGTSGGRVSNSRFAGDCGIGSEGDGGISGLTLDHLDFEAPATARPIPALNIQRMTDLTVDHVHVHGRSMLFYVCDRCRLAHSSVDGLVVTSPYADWGSALNLSTVIHDFSAIDNRFVVLTAAAVPVVSIGPVRPNYQADIARITITYSDLIQGTTAPAVSAYGVDGMTLSNSFLTLNPLSVPVASGPSVAAAPAVSMPALNIVESGNTITVLP
jgi:hypothetical protein